MRGRGAGATIVAVVSAAMAAWSLTACGSTATRSATTTSAPSATQKAVSKLPPEVTQTVARLDAGGKPGDTTANFTSSGVPVRDDGKLQLELHATGPVTDAQQAELAALGADIVASGSAVGIVDAWVPFTKVDEAAALPWVVSVTVPSPTRRP